MNKVGICREIEMRRIKSEDRNRKKHENMATNSSNTDMISGFTDRFLSRCEHLFEILVQQQQQQLYRIV